jgi:hypothetical protein
MGELKSDTEVGPMRHIYLFQGGIDDVRVYDRELTATEVRKIFNAGQ